MQNTQTAQQAQNTQTVTVSVSTAQKAADALFAYEQLADAAETIALTIRELADVKSNVIIRSQAELLTRLIEQARFHHDAKETSYDLYEVVDMAEEAAAKEQAGQTAR